VLLAQPPGVSAQCRSGFLGASDGKWFGENVALHGNRALLANPTPFPPRIEIFELQGSNWIGTPLVPSELEGGVGSGVDVFGSLALVCAPFPTQDPLDPWGVVYVFEETAGIWSQTAIVDPPQRAHVVSTDGERILIGDREAGVDHGSAWVYAREDGAWTLEYRFLPGPDDFESHFGTDVALVGDVAVITSPDGYPHPDPAYSVGAVHVFARGQDGWGHRQILYALHPLRRLHWVRSLAFDGERIAICFANADEIPGHPGATSGGDPAVFVFDRDDRGTPLDPTDDAWPQTAILESVTGKYAREVALAPGRVLVSSHGSWTEPGDGVVFSFLETPVGWLEEPPLAVLDGTSIDADGELFVVNQEVFGWASALASATPRAGSGSNPVAFAARSLPLLGQAWTASIEPQPGTLATIVAVGAGGPAAGIYLPAGELLCLPPIVAHDVAADGSHALAIPDDCALAGRALWTQGARFSARGLELLNAIDLVVGTE
jgi:hypothetical protein